MYVCTYVICSVYFEKLLRTLLFEGRLTQVHSPSSSDRFFHTSIMRSATLTKAKGDMASFSFVLQGSGTPTK